MDWQVPLCRPEFREAELQALIASYRSGWLTAGPRTAELEENFSRYTGARYAIAVSSCSAALHLACRAAGIGPGDEVIVPSLTFSSTVNAITHLGATPRFAEIASPTEPWLSVQSVEEAIDFNTKAILVLSYGGHMGQTAEIAELAKRHGLILLEDAAHSCGSWLDGKHAGTFGLAGAFSFSGSKNIGIGEGGMVITDDQDFAAQVSRQRWHGLSSQAWDRHHQKAPRYELEGTGFNYRLDDPKAALINACLASIDEDNRRRASVAAVYREAFEDLEFIEATAMPTEPSSHCMFTAVLDESIDRDKFRGSIAARGVQTSVHYPPVHLSDRYACTETSLPVTEDYANRSVTLPMFPRIASWQQDLVTRAVREALLDPARALTAA